MLRFVLLLPVVTANVLPPIFSVPAPINFPMPMFPQQIVQNFLYRSIPQPVPYNQIGNTVFPGPQMPLSPMGPEPIGPDRPPCPMSPLATFLNEEQQETLHELITEARSQGADEPTVKQHINKYLSEILTPQKMGEFESANEQFEAGRRQKRSSAVEEKRLPQKVFDLVDKYSNDYQHYYEESSAQRQRASP